MTSNGVLRPHFPDLWRITIGRGEHSFYYAAVSPHEAMRQWILDWQVEDEETIDIEPVRTELETIDLLVGDEAPNNNPRPLWRVYLEKANTMGPSDTAVLVSWPAECL